MTKNSTSPGAQAAPQDSAAGPRIRQRTRPGAASEPVAPAPNPIEGEPAQYEVGYGRPPRRSQFRRGQSGNPRGRPRGAKGLKTIVRETLTAKITMRTPNGTKRVSTMEALIKKAAELALKGDMRALSQLITHYGNAVPEALPTPMQPDQEVEELTATELAILEEFKAQCLREAGVQS